MNLLSNPDAALLTLFAGVLLLYLECNRPGLVMPGCVGVLLSLLAFNAFAHMPLDARALVLLLLGAAFIIRGIARASGTLFPAAGIFCLIAGFLTLVQPISFARVHLASAILAGGGLGWSSLWLGRVALRARRSKRAPSSSLRAEAAIPARQPRTG